MTLPALARLCLRCSSAPRSSSYPLRRGGSHRCRLALSLALLPRTASSPPCALAWLIYFALFLWCRSYFLENSDCQSCGWWRSSCAWLHWPIALASAQAQIFVVALGSAPGRRGQSWSLFVLTCKNLVVGKMKNHLFLLLEILNLSQKTWITPYLCSWSRYSSGGLFIERILPQLFPQESIKVYN